MHSVWKTSIRFTLVTAVLLGLGYPLLVTGIAGLLFPHQAAGSLILHNGQVIGSELLAQSFTSDRYFHPRPSAAGNGYDATSSGGIESGAIQQDARHAHPGRHRQAGRAEPRQARAHRHGDDLRLRPRPRHHSRHRLLPGSARGQGARHRSEDRIRKLIDEHTTSRQLGFLGEPRVNVLELNLALDQISK